jgi:hypothetical protein
MRILSYFRASNVYGVLDANAFDDWANESFFVCMSLYSCVDPSNGTPYAIFRRREGPPEPA